MENRKRNNFGTYPTAMPKAKPEDIEHDCKVAYLLFFDSCNEKVKSKEKLTQILQQVGRNPTKRMVNKYWRENTVSISFKEFCDICRREPRTSEEKLMNAFKKLDTNGDGYLTVYELQKVLTSKGEKMKPSEVKAIIAEVDENRDGKLDYNEKVSIGEFCKMVLKTQNESQRFAEDLMERKLNRQQSGGRMQDRRRGNSMEDDDRDRDWDRDDEKGDRDRRRDRSKDVPRDLSRGKDYARDRSPEDRFGSARSKPTSARLSTGRSRDGLDRSFEDERNNGHRRDGYSWENDRRRLMDEDRPQSRAWDRESENRLQPLRERNKSASRYSDDERQSDDDSRVGMKPSHRPNAGGKASRLGNAYDRSNEDDQRTTRRLDLDESVAGGNRVFRKLAVSSVTNKMPRPKNIKAWKNLNRRGCFYFNDTGLVVGHQYMLKLAADSAVYFQLEPTTTNKDDLDGRYESQGMPVDTMLLIQTEGGKTVAVTETRGPRGEYGTRCDLQRGRYRLTPFTSGCRFKKVKPEARKEAKLVKEVDRKWTITRPFRDALATMFAMADLDGDGYLTRDEFSWYTLRTEGAEVDDDKWQVVQDVVKLDRGRLTLDSFISLTEIEAEESQGDCHDFWVTLGSMGFNKDLTLNEACPFMLNAYVESSDAAMTVVALEPTGNVLDKALADISKAKGQPHTIKQMKDVFIYAYATDFYAWLLIENKSRNAALLELDCSRSSNVVTNRAGLRDTVKVPAGSVKIGHFILPERENKDWMFTWKENVA